MKFRPIILLLCISVSLAAQAHEPGKGQYHLIHYTDENGLPQNSVKFLAPDKAGFLWLATENGLLRFDGSRFEATHTNRISYMYPGPGWSGMYALTQEGSVISITGGKAETMAEPAWKRAGHDDYEYVLYDDSKGTYPATGLPNLFSDLADVKSYIIPVAAGTEFRFRNDSIFFIRKNKVLQQAAWFKSEPRHFFTTRNSLYYLRSNGQFYLFRNNAPQPVAITGDVPAGPLQAQDLYWNYLANQMFLFQGNKFYHLTATANGSLISKLILEGIDAKRNDIFSIYYDAPHERVFLGSRSRGLYIFTKKQFSPLVSPGGQDNIYYAQAPFGSNDIATPQGILFNGEGHTSRLPVFAEINKNSRYSLLRDSAGNYWYRYANVLYKLNSTLTKILWQRTMGDDGISQLSLGPNGILWIGMEKGGLYNLDVNDASPVPLLFSRDLKATTSIAYESPGVIWAGTTSGLYRIVVSPRKVDTIHAIAEQHVRSLFIPRQNELWITTYGGGMYLYRDTTLVHLPEDRQGYLKTAHCIVEDRKGYFWITTNKGMFQAAHRDLIAFADGRQHYVYYHYYNKNSGLLTNEFNGGCQPCALTMSNGDISFPSLDGLLRFKPELVHPELPAGPLVLNEAELDGRFFSAGDTIPLPNDYLRLNLKLSTPYFGDPYNLHIYYALQGGEGDAWLPVDNNGVIPLSRLPSGSYKLRIRKINGFGVNNFTEMTINLVVEAAWFETTWFKTLAVMSLGLLLFLYIRLRMRHMRRKNRKLKQHVYERTRKLQDALSSLRISERRLRKQGVMQQRLMTAITHDIKTPMKFLMLLTQTGKMTEEKVRAMNDALYRMYNMVENLIQYMKAETGSGRASRELVDMHELLEEKAGIFRPIAESRSITIHNKAARGILVPVNRQLLAIVVNNLLDNAVKYTLEGSVHLDVSYSAGSQVSIRVTDTGVGMKPEVREWINHDRATLLVDERRPALQKGVGLVIVMELLQQIDGRLVVHDGEEPGTCLEVLLKVDAIGQN